MSDSAGEQPSGIPMQGGMAFVTARRRQVHTIVENPKTSDCHLWRMDMCSLVGRNCARLRLQKGLTQEDVSARSGISQQYLSCLERGKCNPTIVTLHELAQALGVDHMDLVRSDAKATSQTPKPTSSTRSPRRLTGNTDIRTGKFGAMGQHRNPLPDLGEARRFKGRGQDRDIGRSAGNDVAPGVADHRMTEGPDRKSVV